MLGVGGLSPLGSHSEKEGIGCALTDTNDEGQGAAPLDANCNATILLLKLLHYLPQRVAADRILMMQVLEASYWTTYQRECQKLQLTRETVKGRSWRWQDNNDARGGRI